MEQWKELAATVVLQGNPDLPAASNDLTMGHIVAVGPLLVIALLHPRKWLTAGPPVCFLLLGCLLPLMPASLSAKLTTIPEDPTAQGQIFGGDPFVLARLAYWYMHVAPIPLWTPVLWIAVCIGNIIVYVDTKHYLHAVIKLGCIAGSVYITIQAVLRLAQDEQYKNFLDNVLNKAVMEDPTVKGEVSGTHVFFDVLMFVAVGAVHVVLEAPLRIWELFLGPAGTLTAAAHDSTKRGPNTLAGMAYMACGVVGLLLWLPHQMQYGDKVWSMEAYDNTRGASQKTNADIEFCFVCTKFTLFGMLFTAHRIFADIYNQYSFLLVQYWLIVLTGFSIMQLAVTTSFVMAVVKLTGDAHSSTSTKAEAGKND